MRVPLQACAHNYIRTMIDSHHYTYFYRFTDEQMKAYEGYGFFRMMSRSPAGVYISFHTTGSSIKIKYKARNVFSGVARIIKDMGIASVFSSLGEMKSESEKSSNKTKFSDSIDIYIGGKLYARKKLHGGKVKLHFNNMFKDNKYIQIYLPLYFEVGIKYIKTNGDVGFNRNERPHILCLGDSITQGFIADGPSENYVSYFSRELRVHALNQGIGGYYFMEESLADIGEFYHPEFITVAYGTNDWCLNPHPDEIKSNMQKYFLKLTEIYPNTPIYVITPIWRADMEDKKCLGPLTEMIKLIEKEVKKYPQIKIINGLDISLHDTNHYADGFLHPDSVGFKYEADKLVDIFKDVINNSYHKK